MPRVIEVIESETTRGKGFEEDPVRTVVQYWTLDGTRLLAERDAWLHDAQQGEPKA